MTLLQEVNYAMKTLLLFTFSIFINQLIFAQSYTSYFTGSNSDIITSPEGGICMMGGATEHDEAMKWFLNRANGGDVLVLRASGSDGYNDYFYTQLGVPINSVETIVFNSAAASNETYVQDKIKNAEAIWFAGGDQWKYIDYWRSSAIATLINEAVYNRNIVIGGTSAGMAILGSHYFSAEIGTVTSAQALSNPYSNLVTVDSTHFLSLNYMENVVTDSHYDDPDRKGRHVVFLSRMITDYNVKARGIACNEYTSVCIDENGIARVYGDYPAYPETAYFLQTNCDLIDFAPENCSSGAPLTWNRDSSAVIVYAVNGTNNGVNTFDLNDWQTGNGGDWEYWFVENGIFSSRTGSAPSCDLSAGKLKKLTVKTFPNPVNSKLNIHTNEIIYSLQLQTMDGTRHKTVKNINATTYNLNLENSISGVYILIIETADGFSHQKIIIE